MQQRQYIFQTIPSLGKMTPEQAATIALIRNRCRLDLDLTSLGQMSDHKRQTLDSPRTAFGGIEGGLPSEL